jgi:hypothetical protein
MSFNCRRSDAPSRIDGVRCFISIKIPEPQLARKGILQILSDAGAQLKCKEIFALMSESPQKAAIGDVRRLSRILGELVNLGHIHNSTDSRRVNC